MDVSTFSLKDAGTRRILIAAVVQGAALYGLHHAVVEQHWPATRPAWLTALYAVALFVPISVQVLAEQGRPKLQAAFIAVLAAAMFGFGWHHGHSVAPDFSPRSRGLEEVFPFALAMGLLWLMSMPFVQTRIATGHWARDYTQLFSKAWRNKLALAEATLFTGALWLLLMLWQQLFHMLGFDFFRELFREPLFVYPVTSLTFGIALHLIGSVERFTATILEQLLNVLKWLGVIALTLLLAFTLALLVKLPGLAFSGEKAIGAVWLLWLVAVLVLLMNAAFRDGTTPLPYPATLARAFRFVVPLMVVVALTAFYALLIRVREYGLTVDRFWGLIVAVTAVLYAAGYALAAFDRERWFGGIARVNVGVAIALIALLVLTHTPLVSPYRLAAVSQFRQALKPARSQERETGARASPMRYLRFDSGRYGLDELQRLAQWTEGPTAAEIRKRAGAALALNERWTRDPPADTEGLLAKMPTYPPGSALDEELRALVRREMQPGSPLFQTGSTDEETGLAGVFIDLNGDAQDEFVAIRNFSGAAFSRKDGRWTRIGSVETSSNPGANTVSPAQRLRDNAATSEAPRWNDLRIGPTVLRVAPETRPTP